jgi:hypothetical protein
MGIKPYFFSDSFLDFQTHFWIIVFYWILERVQYKPQKSWRYIQGKIDKLPR